MEPLLWNTNHTRPKPLCESYVKPILNFLFWEVGASNENIKYPNRANSVGKYCQVLLMPIILFNKIEMKFQGEVGKFLVGMRDLGVCIKDFEELSHSDSKLELQRDEFFDRDTEVRHDQFSVCIAYFQVQISSVQSNLLVKYFILRARRSQ